MRDAGELQDISARHLGYFTDLAERCNLLLMLAEVAELALADGELDVATARSTRLLELAVHIGDRERTLLGLTYIACALARAGHLERAGRIYGVLEQERTHQSDRAIASPHAG